MREQLTTIDQANATYVKDLQDCAHAIDLQADELEVNLLRYEMLYSESEAIQMKVCVRLLRVQSNNHRIEAMRVVANYVSQKA